MEFYVINLKTEATRRAWMSKQLTALGANFQFFDAIDLKDVASRFAAFRDDERRQALQPTEIACMLSHIGCWKLIADGASDFAVVLEDDVHFAPGFGDMLTVFDADPEEFAVHKLETFLATVTVERKPRRRWGRRSAHKLLTNHGGAAAYILSRSTAKTLVQHAAAFRLPVDNELFDLGRRAHDDLTVYQWLPAPCIQDQILILSRILNPDWSADQTSAQQGFSSSIVEGGRARHFAGREALKHRVKRALRAPYVLLYSMLLFPHGRRRVQVLFG